MNIKILIKLGGLVSSAGVIMLILFLITIMVFPVQKSCDIENKCRYFSTAYSPFKEIVNPIYFSISLSIIASGILMLRVGRKYEYKD